MMPWNFAVGGHIIFGKSPLSIILLLCGATSFFSSIYLFIKHKPLPEYRQIVYMSFFLGSATIIGLYFWSFVESVKYNPLLLSAWFVPWWFWIAQYKGDLFLLYPYFHLFDILRKDFQRKAVNLLLKLTSPSAPGTTKLVFLLYLQAIVMFFVWGVFSK